MNMVFVLQWLQYSQMMIAVLMMLALVALPMAPLWGQNNHAKGNPGEAKSEGAMANGTYLYGQSPQADQLGKEYIVFEVSGDKVVGALYMPRSEFSCFQGEITANELEMTVEDPYNESTHSYAIALEPQSPMADRNGAPETPITLEGYHPLEEISPNDKRMLATCQKEFQ
ncbi:MAG: hypothetical protein BRC33_09760 [Cyanobacteria bacterium SW_9_44_58]|nr:MAG: hypothetical protein BRC33_09760 [Cyanobacteria bacterium SW_9_44_58]